MGLIARIQRVTMARIQTFLDSVEDPEIMFPQLVAEMEDQIRAATNAEAKALGAVKAAQRQVDEIKGRMGRLAKGAELAVQQGEDATARDAVAAQIGAEEGLKSAKDAMARSETALQSATDARKQLQEQLQELRAKKDELLTRARLATTQKKVQKTVSGPSESAKSILDAVSKMEAKVQESEAELEVQREMDQGSKAGPSLDKKLKNLEMDAEIQKRFAALQAKVGGKKKK